MLFDSHAHINSEKYNKNREEIAGWIENSEVAYVMDVGCDLESSVMTVENVSKYEWCYGAVGCHPHEAKTMDEETILMFKGLARKPKIKAIGEIGLDYHYDHSPRDVQQYWFREQIKLALELNMPIIIHDREANNDTMQILKQENAFDTKVLLHCYSGSAELAKEYIKLGATISIAGPVTFKNSRKAVEVVQAVPIEKLLVETDSPYLAPEPYRGKMNMPMYVKHTAMKIADIKGMDYDEVAGITCENAKRFFNIDD